MKRGEEGVKAEDEARETEGRQALRVSPSSPVLSSGSPSVSCCLPLPSTPAVHRASPSLSVSWEECHHRRLLGAFNVQRADLIAEIISFLSFFLPFS